MIYYFDFQVFDEFLFILILVLVLIVVDIFVREYDGYRLKGVFNDVGFFFKFFKIGKYIFKFRSFQLKGIVYCLEVIFVNYF